MKKKMIIEALLHTLLPTYGNENVYHPDGSAIPVADLVARFCQPESPTGKALELEEYESSLDNLAQAVNGEAGDTGVSEAYYVYQAKLQCAIQAKFPNTKFANF